MIHCLGFVGSQVLLSLSGKKGQNHVPHFDKL